MWPGIRVVGLVLALGCLWVGVGGACSCVPSLPLQNAESAEIIVIGQLLDREVYDPGPGETWDSGYPVRHRFLVAEALAGDPGRVVEIYSAADEATCGYAFRDSTVYLVFASTWNGHLSTGLCSGNRMGEAVMAAGDEVRAYLQWAAKSSPDGADRRALRAVLSRNRLAAGPTGMEAAVRRVDRSVVAPLLASSAIGDRLLGTRLLPYLRVNDRTMSRLRASLADSPVVEAAATEAMARLLAQDHRFAEDVGALLASEHDWEARAAIRAFTSSYWEAGPWRAAIEAHRSNPFLAADVEAALARIPVETPR